MLEVDKVNLISGIYCNTALFPAAPLLNRSKIPVLAVGATTGDKTGIGDQIFRIFPADPLSLKALLPEIEKRGRRLCLLTETDAYSALIERTVLKDWPRQSQGAAVFSESVNAGERDFRSALVRLTRRGCDSVFINACGDDGFIAAFKQLKAIRDQVPVFAIYYPGSKSVQVALGDTLRGVVYADLASSDALVTPLGSEFVKRYRERYGDFLIAQPIALLAFEALRVISEARAQGVPLAEFLRRGTIRNGAINPYSFDSDGAVQGIDFQVVTY
jgi:ABC-type branched-subunit amino acid transport system substrate-binding protein